MQFSNDNNSSELHNIMLRMSIDGPEYRSFRYKLDQSKKNLQRENTFTVKNNDISIGEKTKLLISPTVESQTPGESFRAVLYGGQIDL